MLESIFTVVISTVLSCVASIIVTRIQCKHEIKKIEKQHEVELETMREQSRIDIQKFHEHHLHELEKMREEFNLKTKGEDSEAFSRAMKLVAFVAKSGTEKASAYAAVTSIRGSYTGELASTLDKLCDALLVTNKSKVSQLLSKAISQYRDYKVE